MTSDVNHVVGACHDIKVAVFVDHARIAGLVITGKGVEVAFEKAFLGVPKCRQRSGGQGQFDCNRAQLIRFHLVACFVKDLHVIARHCHGWAADLDW